MSCFHLDTMDIRTGTIIFLTLFIPVSVLYDQIGMMHTSNLRETCLPAKFWWLLSVIKMWQDSLDLLEHNPSLIF